MKKPENQGVIEIDIGLIFEFLTTSGLYTEGEVFPSIFLNYVTATNLKQALWSFVETEKQLPG